MAINLEERFGIRNNAVAKAARSIVDQDQPKAKFWLNVGLPCEPNADGNYSFLSLPIGIPLDTMKSADSSVRNEELAEFRDAQNDLHEQIMEYASKLEPGEDMLVNLQVQIRHVKEDAPAPSRGSNRFIKKLEFNESE